MSLHVSLVGRSGLSDEIYRQIRRAILDGRLRAGDRLSPSRDLAQSLAVSRMTVTVAYERLAGEGFVTSRLGSGTFVSNGVTRAVRQTRRSDGVLRPRGVWETIAVARAFDKSARYEFRTGLPDASLFPHRTWRRLIVSALRSESADVGVYGDPAGQPDLRAAIARHIGVSRGVDAVAEDIIITNGTQQALDIIVRALLARPERIAVEDPGYGPARQLFKSLGLRVVGVPVDDQGLVVGRIPTGVRAVYVTPSHQHPLGVSMTLQRRQALLEWARQNNAAILEDDYDSEFRFGGRPLEPLQTLDASGRVVYMGSFSKTLLPTLRVGFVVAPRSLFGVLQKAKFVSDWHTTTVMQTALARFIEDGGFARHLRKVSAVYQERHAMVIEAVSRDFADQLELVPSEAGLHVAALARTASLAEMDAVARRASDAGVAIQVLSKFAAGKSARAGLVLGYGAIPTDNIREGLRRLRTCFR